MPDFNLDNHGSLYLLTPMTLDAADFCAETWPQQICDGFGSIAAECRYAPEIAASLCADGFTVALNGRILELRT